MNLKSINYKDTTVSYETNGNGYPIVLIHGFGEDHTIWADYVKELSKKYHCIVPKIPGSGGAALLPGLPSIDEYADVVKAILNNEDVRFFNLVGHSMGGYISLAFAKKYPEGLKGLTLFHSSAYKDSEEKKETRRKAIRLIEESGPKAFLKTAIPGLFHDQQKHSEAIQELLKKAEQFTGESLIQYYQAMIGRKDTTDVLKNLIIPVQFILGANDKAVPFDDGMQQSHLPQESSLTILRSTAHMGMIEESEKGLQALQAFVGECSVK